MTRPHKGEKQETTLFCSAKIPRSSLLFLVCTCPLSIYVRYGNDPTKLFYAVSTDFVCKKLVLGKFCGSMECESFQSVFCQQSPDCGNCDCDYHVCFISWGLRICANAISRKGYTLLSVFVFNDGTNRHKPDPAVFIDERSSPC